MAHDNCDHCGQDYDFRPEIDRLFVYPLEPHYNHVFATCPHCGLTTRIYVDIDALVSLYKTLPPDLYANVHKHVRHERANLDLVLEPPAEPETFWLSPRIERSISYFHDQLERGLQE